MKRKSCTDRVSVLNWITLSLFFFGIFEMRSKSFSRAFCSFHGMSVAARILVTR